MLVPLLFFDSIADMSWLVPAAAVARTIGPHQEHRVGLREGQFGRYFYLS